MIDEGYLHSQTLKMKLVVLPLVFSFVEVLLKSSASNVNNPHQPRTSIIQTCTPRTPENRCVPSWGALYFYITYFRKHASILVDAE